MTGHDGGRERKRQDTTRTRQERRIQVKPGQEKSKHAKKEQDKKRAGKPSISKTTQTMTRQEFRTFCISTPRCSGNYEDSPDHLRHISPLFLNQSGIKDV